jgi:cellular retinoic acid-binding protein 2
LFRLGEEFDENTTDGRKCKTTVVMEGNKLILTQKATRSGEKEVLDIMEFTDEGLTMTWTTGDVSCAQVYKRT